MKDFVGNPLKVNDEVAFIHPCPPRLVMGYVVEEKGEKIKVKFWTDTTWDFVEVSRKVVV
ncbi:MAG: hypothetical protein ACYC25_17260 [Paludibacter sp.]